jgi:hypothetical protein
VVIHSLQQTVYIIFNSLHPSYTVQLHTQAKLEKEMERKERDERRKKAIFWVECLHQTKTQQVSTAISAL